MEHTLSADAGAAFLSLYAREHVRSLSPTPHSADSLHVLRAALNYEAAAARLVASDRDPCLVRVECVRGRMGPVVSTSVSRV